MLQLEYVGGGKSLGNTAVQWAAVALLLSGAPTQVAAAAAAVRLLQLLKLPKAVFLLLTRGAQPSTPAFAPSGWAHGAVCGITRVLRLE